MCRLKKLFYLFLLSAGMAGTMANAAPSVNLRLLKEGNRIYARLLVEQPTKTEGKVLVEWFAPPGACANSNYSLAYHNKNFHTYCYRTLVHKIKDKTYVCTGDWKVNVKDESGNILTTLQLVV